jgi:preprotein translocase SecE subunit
MARNRQRAKQRQAERRAARLAGARPVDAPEPVEAPEPDEVEAPEPDEVLPEDEEELLEEFELETGAPPQDTGRSDTVVEHPPPPPDTRAREDDGLPQRRAGAPEGRERRRRARLISFLIAVWAELKRVEWPDRQALTTLTAVVLVFVVIMGAYLGGLDALFSKIINQIL